MERDPRARRSRSLTGPPRIAWYLGAAGLLPQVFALAATMREGDRFIGLAAGYFYAALILSFIGGLWWGVASASDDPPDWLYGAAVAPSLIAFASGIPWMIGATWPGPSLALLGLAIIACLRVDNLLLRHGLISVGLFRLRLALSFGLGSLTLALATRA